MQLPFALTDSAAALRAAVVVSSVVSAVVSLFVLMISVVAAEPQPSFWLLFCILEVNDGCC